MIILKLFNYIIFFPIVVPCMLDMCATYEILRHSNHEQYPQPRLLLLKSFIRGAINFMTLMSDRDSSIRENVACCQMQRQFICVAIPVFFPYTVTNYAIP